MALTPYSLDQIEEDIADLRGQVDQLLEIIKFQDSTADPTNAAVGGAWLYSLLGHLKYKSPDGSFYRMVSSVMLTANAPQCTSTSQTSTGLTASVEAGVQYMWLARVGVASQSTNRLIISVGGPTTSSFSSITTYGQINVATSGHAQDLTLTQATIGVNAPVTSNAPINGEFYWATIQGFATFTASGTLVIDQASSANAASYTVNATSFLLMFPQP